VGAREKGEREWERNGAIKIVTSNTCGERGEKRERERGRQNDRRGRRRTEKRKRREEKIGG
jgi:hypothetical protein